MTETFSRLAHSPNSMKLTQFSKILAVFVTVASLVFVGFAIATTFGGPTWESVTQADYFDGYRIAKQPGTEGQWTAVRGSDEGAVASSKVQAEVLVKVMDDVLAQQRQKIQALEAREQPLQDKIARMQSAETTDEAALTAFQQQLMERLANVRSLEQDVAAQVVAATTEAQKLESQIQARRGDVLRLKEQVLELKADIFRLSEIRDQLTDLLNQLRGNLDLVEQRQRQLAGETYNPPVTN